MKVVFIVTEIADIRKQKSSLELGTEYIGTYHEKNNSVWWTDPMNNENWVFWNNDTCEIVKFIK